MDLSPLHRTCFAGLLLSAPLAAQSVLTVGPSSEFGTLGGALGAAQDGDLILLESGSYVGFQIKDRSLQVRAMEGADVTIQGTIRIGPLAEDDVVVLDGLDVDTTTPQALAVVDTPGSLWVSRCSFLVTCVPSPGPPIPDSAVDLSNLTGGSGSVVMSRCSVETDLCPASSILGLLAPCFGVLNTNLYFYDGSIQASASTQGLSLLAQQSDASVLLSNSSVKGGDAEATDDCGVPVDGGPGLSMVDSLFGGGNAAVLGRKATITGGSGTTNACGDVGLGGAAINDDLAAADYIELGSTAVSWSGELVVAAGSVLDLAIAGAPGAAARLALGFAPGELNVPGTLETLLVSGDPLRVPLGNLDANGQLQTQLQVPSALGLGEATTVYAQAYTLDASGLTLGTAQAIVILN